MRGYRIHSGPDIVRGIAEAFVASCLVAAVVLFMALPRAERPDSTQPLASNGAIMCTAFSVNDQKHLFVTASHCLADEEGNTLTLGGGAFVVLRTDPVEDLSLLLSVHSAPAYALGPRPGVGDDVSVQGFAFHSPNAVSVFGRVSNPDYVFPNETRHVTVFNLELLRGLSGSPILFEGQVISVAQGVAAPFPVGRLSWGARWEALRDFVGQDWGR